MANVIKPSSNSNHSRNDRAIVEVSKEKIVTEAILTISVKVRVYSNSNSFCNG